MFLGCDMLEEGFVYIKKPLKVRLASQRAPDRESSIAEMAIPDFQGCMLPLLRLAADGSEHTLKEALPALSDEFGLTEAERNAVLPSDEDKVFRNRVAWANTYLKKGWATPI